MIYVEGQVQDFQLTEIVKRHGLGPSTFVRLYWDGRMRVPEVACFGDPAVGDKPLRAAIMRTVRLHTLSRLVSRVLDVAVDDQDRAWIREAQLYLESVLAPQVLGKDGWRYVDEEKAPSIRRF